MCDDQHFLGWLLLSKKYDIIAPPVFLDTKLV
jgi:hypothetical protein